MPDPGYKSETAAMHSKAKELRAKVNAAAKEKNVSVPKTALDNFVDTYKKTKVGPIQRAIYRFIGSLTDKPTFKPNLTQKRRQKEADVATKRAAAKRKMTQAEGTAKRATAAKKSAAAASQESAQRSAVRSAAKTPATKEARKGPPQRAAKTVAKKVTPPKSKPKMYTAIDVNTGKPKFDAPKVTAAQRLKQEDKFKALKAKRKAFSGKFKSITKGKK
jgi:hypothetical protein